MQNPFLYFIFMYFLTSVKRYFTFFLPLLWEKSMLSVPCTPLHKKVDCPCPSNWHNMLQMTYVVCHLLASKDRCEVSPWVIDGWFHSHLFLPRRSHLFFSAVAILRKWKRVICKLVQWSVMKREPTGKLLPFPSLTLPHPTRHHFISRVHTPPWFLHPWAQILARTTGVRQVWLRSSWLSLQSVPLLSKVFHGGLSKAGFLLSSIIHDFIGTKWVCEVCEGKNVWK